MQNENEIVLALQREKSIMKKIDCHIHIEKGEYTLDWINDFVKVAVEHGLDEIYLLEHCYRFREFVPMYRSVCEHSDYINTWFKRKGGVLGISNYLRLVEQVRSAKFPIEIKFGLEICYFKEFENLVFNKTKDLGLDFLLGSVHFVDNFAFDHKPEHWQGMNVDRVYQRYFKTSVELAKSALYNGIAHPDCIKLYGHKPSFSLIRLYDELAKELSNNNMYAEQNGGAFRRGGLELGMNIDMLKRMKFHGVRIKTASDAHKPEDVGSNICDLQSLVDIE